MEDIRRQDLKLFGKELLNVWFIGAVVGFFIVSMNTLSGGYQRPFPGWAFGWAIAAAWFAYSAWETSSKKRFSNKRLEALWKGCQDRLKRFEEVLNKMRKEQVADLHEMPATIYKVGDALYAALRRADMISAEIQTSEKDLYNRPPSWAAAPTDSQSRELYRLADKNIAEYRAQFQGVMSGVERTEAQSAVYMTTLDTLRMKMLSYRLVGKQPDLDSSEFLIALSEARAQLSAIDRALDELDFSHYPTTVASVPPPIPVEAQVEIEQNIQNKGQQ